MLDGERLAGASHAGHDFVGDQEDVVVTADFGDPRDVAIRRSGSTKCGANDGFEYERRCGLCLQVVWRGVRIVGLKRGIEIIGTSEAALGKFQLEWAVVAKTWSDVAPFREQRLIRRTPTDIAADRHRAERAAVVTLATRDDSKSFRIASLQPILASELDCG